MEALMVHCVGQDRQSECVGVCVEGKQRVVVINGGLLSKTHATILLNSHRHCTTT